MSRIYNPAIGTTTGFDTEQPIGPIVPESPFPDTSEVDILHQRYVQLSTYYVAPTLNLTTIYGGVTFYLCNDDNFAEHGAGLITWEREWARIPSERVIWEGIDYVMPAVAQTLATFGTTVSVSAVAQAATGSAQMNVIVASGTWYVGQAVGIQWTNTAVTYAQSFLQIQAINPSGANKSLVVYPLSLAFIDGASSARYIAPLSGTAGRLQPTMLGTRAKITFDYFLPGVSGGVSTPADITVYQRFKVVDVNGIELQYVSGASNPTAASWASWVAAPTSNLQDAQDSLFSLWKGQIYERKRVQFCPL